MPNTSTHLKSSVGPQVTSRQERRERKSQTKEGTRMPPLSYFVDSECCATDNPKESKPNSTEMKGKGPRTTKVGVDRDDVPEDKKQGTI